MFDWSIDGDRVWLAVIDARGRNLSAALPAALTLTALRHARRAGLSLAEQVSLADQVVYDHWRGRAEIAATVLSVDLDADRAEMVRAGDDPPAVLLRRGGAGGRVWEPSLPAHEALGCYERSHYRVESVEVLVGDALLVVSAGGPGVQDAAGRAFGGGATGASFGATEGLAGLPHALIEAWREHGGGDLARDATAVVVERRA
nr:PP2C family protein-serine/threonine phosphatase [Actinomycetospora corticicola]